MSKLMRSASIGQATPDGEILLRNLRLLDLDDDFDWPAISKDTFTASDTIKNQNRRIRRAEWILYKLFEIWNPSETQQKLRPYFPALEPLQSINLRTALFRALSELKKVGVFRKDIFVRKSMLDDCKGPRFEEVLAALSTSVVYKILAEDDSDTSVVRQLLLGKEDMASIDYSIFSISYRASLTKRLSKKEELGQQYRKFGRMLDLKGHEIEQRGRSNLIASREWTERSVPQRTIIKLTKHLSENWQGDQSWINILVQSDSFQPRHSLLEQPFDKIWHHVTNDTLYKIRPDNKQSLLEDLEGRVLIQNERLEKWKQIKENMNKDTQCASESTSSYLDKTEKAVDSSRQHSRRESLILSPRQKQHRAKNDAELRDTFNKATFQDGKSRVKDIQRKSRPSIDEIGPTGPLTIAADHESQLYSEQISGIETPSLTTDDDSLDTNSGTDCMRPESNNAAGNFGHSADEFLPLPIDLQAESQKLATLERSTPITCAQTVITQMPLSLAERTRMSMALISPVKVLRNEETQLQIAPVPPLTHQEDDLNSSAPFPSTGGTYRSASLLDRTRHSMSLMSATSQGRRQSLKPRVSKVYPVNQFNSPGREQSLIEPAEASILEVILPDAEADYETVFKSRPKIALSPRLSPVQDGMPYSAAAAAAAAEAECREAGIGLG
ncbi:hypothetical protein MMC27_003928 [Xylographa pallens]|nr:hypothetical protein [Xylographa pallens]